MMDWRNIVRPVVIILLVVCLVLFGVHKVRDTYTGFMKEYEGTSGTQGGQDVEITIPEHTSIKEAASILKDAGLIKYKLAFQLRMTGSQYSNSLQRFSKPHVVGEYAAESVLAKRLYPLESVLLVSAHHI